MKTLAALIATITAAATAASLTISAAAQEPAEQGLDPAAAAEFEKMIEANRTAGSLQFTSTMTITLSQAGVESTGEPVEASFARLKGRDGVIEINGYTIHINGDKLFAIHESNPEEYFQHDITDFVHAAIVWECFGSPDRLPFPMLAALWGSDLMEELYMELHAETSEVAPTALLDRTVDGAAVRTIRLSGRTGSIDIDTDPQSKRIQRIDVEVTNQSFVPAGTTKTVAYELEYANDQTLDGAAVAFAPGDRQKVGSMISLEKTEEILAVAPVAGDAGGGPMVGQEAPGFILPNLGGDLVDLANLRGSVVVLDFWATWCPPCVEALPLLHDVAAWAKEQNMPAQVFAVNTHEDGATLEERIATVNRFRQDREFTLPVLMDHEDSVAEKYGVQGIPTTFIIAPDGTITAQHGFTPGYVEELKKAIRDALSM